MYAFFEFVFSLVFMWLCVSFFVAGTKTYMKTVSDNHKERLKVSSSDEHSKTLAIFLTWFICLFLLFPVAYIAGNCLFNLMYGITNGS